MKTLVALLLAVLIPVQSFATECSNPVSLLQEGAAAPCRGYLFSPDKELQVRTDKQDSLLVKQELDNLNQTVERLNKELSESNKIIDDRTQQAELWRVRAIESTKELTAANDGRQSRDLLFIGLGVVITILSAWAYKQVNTAR